METRGIRNNNPLNIRKGSNWKGLSSIQSDKSFCQFLAMEYGVRAALCVLRTYKYKYHLVTLRDVISRFAPALDGNNVERYCYLVRMNMIQIMNECAFRFKSDSCSISLFHFIEEMKSKKDSFVVNRWLNKKTPMFPMFYLIHAMALVESSFSIKYTLYRSSVNLL